MTELANREISEAGATRLFGRDVERRLLAAALDDAASGRSAVLVLRGEMGIGKSALLSDAASRAVADGLTVLRCRGIESESQLPFSGVHQLLLPVSEEIGALPEVQAIALRSALGLEHARDVQPLCVSVAILELLAHVARGGPLLCVIDDAQWLDEASAQALVFVARRLAAEEVAMLFAAREDDMVHFEAPGLPDAAIRGLSGDEAAALLDHHAGAGLAGEVRLRLVSATRGNPLALLELSSGLTPGQRSGEEPLRGPVPLSAHVERSFLARVRRLPRDTQALLVVAAADDSGELAVVLEAAESLGLDVSALDLAEEHDLLVPRDGALEFRHPLLRAAVYHGAPLSQRRAAHRALAGAMAGEARADRRAWHRAIATVGPDPQAVAELESAAERARRRGGFAAASLAWERAALLTAEDDRRAGQLTAAGQTAWAAGRIERAAALLARARGIATRTQARAAIDRTLALIEFHCGVPTAASPALLQAAVAVAADDHEQAHELVAIACAVAIHMGDPDAIRAIVTEAREFPGRDAAHLRLWTELLEGVGAHYDDDFDAAAAHLRQALELCDPPDPRSGPPAASPERLLLTGSSAALLIGDDEACRELHRQAVASCRESCAVGTLTHALAGLAMAEIWAGQWSAAAAAVREALEVADESGLPHVGAYLRAEEALVAGLSGDEEVCRTLAARSAETALPHDLRQAMYVSNWALMNLELALGRPERALMRAETVAGSGVHWDALDRIEAAVRAGEPVVARRAVDDLDRWARPAGASWGLAIAEHGRALLSADPAAAERRFRAALELHERCCRPFERARTQLAFGERLRRERRRKDARTQLRLALETFEGLGAALWAERARVELRASGQTARRRDVSTLDQLTAQELQIARSVAEGRTNRDVAAQLFLSPRTVDFHLRNIFRKLDLTSRVELARIDLGAEPDVG